LVDGRPKDYLYEVRKLLVKAEEKKSSKGNDMYVLDLRVFHNNRSFYWKDYIVVTQEFKFRRSCDTFGILNAYKSANVDASDYMGKSGKAKIGIQPEKDGYPARNNIAEYLSRELVLPEKVDLQDSIPF
jgi:hypothetical protein